MSYAEKFQVQARELTDEERVELEQTVNELDRDIKRGIREMHRVSWDLARLMHEMNEKQGWHALGMTKDEWLEQSAIGLTRRTFDRWAQAYRELVEVRHVDESALTHYDLTKVQVVLPQLQVGGVLLDDALDDIETLSLRQLTAKYATLKQLPPAREPAVGPAQELEDDDEEGEEWEEVDDELSEPTDRKVEGRPQREDEEGAPPLEQGRVDDLADDEPATVAGERVDPSTYVEERARELEGRSTVVTEPWGDELAEPAGEESGEPADELEEGALEASEAPELEPEADVMEIVCPKCSHRFTP